MEYVKVPVDLLRDVLNYMLTRPLGEVNDFFHALNQLPVESDPEPVAEAG